MYSTSNIMAGAVIGNHVHKSLQVKRNNCNILHIIFIPFQDQHTHTLCSSLIDTALKHTPQLVEKQLLCVRSDQEKGSQHYLLVEVGGFVCDVCGINESYRVLV